MCRTASASLPVISTRATARPLLGVLVVVVVAGVAGGMRAASISAHRRYLVFPVIACEDVG
jgi:hypothetical protein